MEIKEHQSFYDETKFKGFEFHLIKILLFFQDCLLVAATLVAPENGF